MQHNQQQTEFPYSSMLFIQPLCADVKWGVEFMHMGGLKIMLVPMRTTNMQNKVIYDVNLPHYYFANNVQNLINVSSVNS